MNNGYCGNCPYFKNTAKLSPCTEQDSRLIRLIQLVEGNVNRGLNLRLLKAGIEIYKVETGNFDKFNFYADRFFVLERKR